MSNYLAIATVTSALQLILSDAVAPVNGSRVTVDRPFGEEGDGPRVNIFLYQVLPHAAWRNSDAREQAAVDLYYLLTFYGELKRFEPQRLLGCVVRKLHEERLLSPDTIAAVELSALADAVWPAPSDLALQEDPVRFSPLPLSLDDLSKIWSGLLQTPYALSIAYQVGAVWIDSDERMPSP